MSGSCAKPAPGWIEEDALAMTAETAVSNDSHQARARVFISYSRRDIAFVDRLEAALKARNFEPLVDRTEIYAFEDWWKRIEALIARADTIVFVLSPDAVDSEVSRKEVAFAASLNKRFAPIVFRTVNDKSVPQELAKLNFVFFTDESRFEANADRLAQALDTDIVWIRQHTEFGELARRWKLANESPGLFLRSPVLDQAERWIASRPPNAPVPTQETQVFISGSRQAATRRRNILTGSLAAGLVISLGLAGLAYWQRGVAVEQRALAEQNEALAKEERDRATRNFKLAQSTAESLVSDIAQGLRNVQGMRADAVRRILDTSRGTVDQLAASAPDDPTLQRSRGIMLAEFGTTYRTLGDLDQAQKAFRDGLAIAESLAAASPRNTLLQHDLSAAYVNVGDVDAAQGRLDDALKAYRSGLDIAVHLVAAAPNYAERDLSVAHNAVGDVLVVQGEFDAALGSYLNGLIVAEKLASTNPSNTRWQRDLSVSHNKVAGVLKVQGQLDNALKAYREGLAIRERLAAGEPSSTQFQRDLSVSYDNVGGTLVAQGRIDEALAAFRDGLVIAERLAAADRSDTGWQRDLAVGYGNIGNILVTQRRFDEAQEAFRSALGIAERLAAAAPTNTGLQRDLFVLNIKLGDVLTAQDKFDEGLKAYRASLDAVSRLAKADPGNLRRRDELLFAVDRVSDTSYKLLLARNFTTALAYADEVISFALDTIHLQRNRAHALMFLDRINEARTLYLQYRGQNRVIEEKSWDTVVLGDFAEMRQGGLTHPLMDEIEKLFTSRN